MCPDVTHMWVAYVHPTPERGYYSFTKYIMVSFMFFSAPLIWESIHRTALVEYPPCVNILVKQGWSFTSFVPMNSLHTLRNVLAYAKIAQSLHKVHWIPSLLDGTIGGLWRCTDVYEDYINHDCVSKSGLLNFQECKLIFSMTYDRGLIRTKKSTRDCWRTQTNYEKIKFRVEKTFNVFALRLFL